MPTVWVKVLLVPSMLYLAQILFSSRIRIPSMYHTLILGFIIIVAAIAIEIMYLKNKGVWFTTAVDFAAASALVYLAGRVDRGAHITFLGVVLAGILVAAAEYGQHVWMLRTGHQWVKNRPDSRLKTKMKAGGEARLKENKSKERSASPGKSGSDTKGKKTSGKRNK